MRMIKGLAGTAPSSAATSRVHGAGGGFRMPDGGQAAATPGVGPTMAVGLAGMLALQEVQGQAVGDREARRHGHDMLAELVALQRSLLGPDAAANLARLARLAEAVPTATDPTLREAISAIALRARIEIARHETCLENAQSLFCAPPPSIPARDTSHPH